MNKMEKLERDFQSDDKTRVKKALLRGMCRCAEEINI